MAKTPNYLKYPTEYVSWIAMRQRCGARGTPARKNYKNIDVCIRWKLSFESFLFDVGRAPSPEHTLDRLDNSKGYFKDNCRWATRKEQANNRTNNVNYHIHTSSDGKIVVRKYADGLRWTVGTFNSMEEVKLFLGER